MSDVIKKMEQLVSELNAASEVYYGGKGQIMPDAVWNAKFDELTALEDMSGVVLPDSPTHNISHETILGEKVAHEFAALSLPKSKDIADVMKWVNDKSIDLSWKLDGMTLVVTYDDGELTRVVTRGDGEIGSNITHLTDAIGNLPKTIDYKKHLVIRGEAVISYEDFDSVNSNCENAYENPRNLVAGSLNPLTQVDLIMDRHIIWIPFTLVYKEGELSYSWKDRMLFLKSIGFQIVDFEYIENPDDLPSSIEKWSENVNSVVYPVDGLVVVYDDVDYSSKGALTGHHDTRGGFAFKWADAEAETELMEIEWSVSINSINPVAIFKPVRLEGTTVKRASLCNISECERLGIGGSGTQLTVIKANKIIPKVIKASTVGSFVIPDRCPVCNHETYIKTGATDVKILACKNPSCAAKNISKMSRFVSKYGFDINGLSEKKLIDLLNKGLIKNASDIFDLTTTPEDAYAVLSESDGWGEKSIKKLLTAIESAKSVRAENLLYALCIPMCGRDVAKKLTRQRSLRDIIEIAKNNDEHNTMNIIGTADGIGDAKASAFIDWFKCDENIAFVEKLLSVCNIVDNKLQTSASLQGLTFVITGSLENYASRDVLKEQIESLGGKVAGSVSAKTSYLINNDVTSTSGKNKKAQALNVPIISESDFIAKFLS